MPAVTQTKPEVAGPGLLRQIGFFSATALVISNMAGTGIFTTTLRGKTPAALNGDWAILIKKTGDYQIAKRVGTSGQLLVSGHARIAGANFASTSRRTLSRWKRPSLRI